MITKLLQTIVLSFFLPINLFAQGYYLNSNTLAMRKSLDSGLVAYYPFNGNANDESGNGYNGTINGDVSLTSDRCGNLARAFHFDGDNDYIEIPFYLNTDVSEFSISAFFRVDTVVGAEQRNIFQLGNGGSIAGGYNGFQLDFSVHLSNGNWYTAGYPAKRGMWYHFVGIYKRGQYIKLFLNRNLEVTVTLPNLDLFREYNLLSTIGAYVGLWGQYTWWFGELDDFRFYNRVLYESEIDSLFHENRYLTPSISGNVYHNLNGNGIKDSSDYGLRGWKVRITGTETDSVLTDADGYYSFDSLPLGSYTVSVDIFPFWEQTQPVSPSRYSVTITDSGAFYVRNDFGVRNLSGLIAYYPFNGDANDESGNGNQGTVHGGATLTTDRFGNLNKAYEFNGSDGYIEIPVHLAIDIPEFSFFAFVLVDTLAGTEQRNFLTLSNGGEMGGVYDRDTISYGVKLANDLWYGISESVLKGRWYSVAGVYTKGLYMKLYMNGNFIDSTSLPDLNLHFSPSTLLSSIGAYVETLGMYMWFRGKIDDVRLYNRVISDSEIQTLYYEGGWDSLISISVQNRWNLVSLPMYFIDNRKTVIFPTAISPAWRYENIYKQSDTLINGMGYWLKFNGTQCINLTGISNSLDTFIVSKGWNLIGSISKPVPISSISSVPSEMITSNFYGYSGSYNRADTIFPGKGYWVKVREAGSLILSLSTQINSKNLIKIVPSSELPPPPPDQMTSDQPSMPKYYVLENAFPSPFNPSTTLRYQLPVDSRVSLKVYNMLGQVVAILSEEQQSAGYYEQTWNASNYASGIYFYRLEATDVKNPAKNFTQVKKMLLIK